MSFLVVPDVLRVFDLRHVTDHYNWETVVDHHLHLQWETEREHQIIIGRGLRCHGVEGKINLYNHFVVPTAVYYYLLSCLL